MGKSIKTRRKQLLSTTFIVFCLLLLFFLYLAPEETTTPLPHDDLHKEFHLIKSKKEADDHCVECHNEKGSAPLPEEHPAPFRCLFCHKRNR